MWMDFGLALLPPALIPPQLETVSSPNAPAQPPLHPTSIPPFPQPASLQLLNSLPVGLSSNLCPQCPFMDYNSV